MPGKIYKILIVEERENVALDLKQMLESNSCSVIGIPHSVNDALKAMKKTVPDLIIFSLLLGDSKTDFHSLMSIQNQYKFPIIFIAGVVELKYYKKKLSSDKNFFLKKPYNTAELLSLIERILKDKYFLVEH